MTKVSPLEFWKSIPKEEFARLREDMKHGFLGKKRTLACSVVVSDFVLNQHLPLYKIFEQGVKVTREQCDSAFFIKNIEQAIGKDHAVEEMWRYFNFFWKMKREEVEIWLPRVFLEQGFCRRFDGKHRVCLLRYFGVKEVECIVATVDDIEKWRTKRWGKDKIWTERPSARPKRDGEAKRLLRQDQHRERRARHEASKKRQRMKRRRGITK